MLTNAMTDDTSARVDLPRGSLEMLILKTLDIQPLHGYGIAQHIQRTSGEALRIEEGSLYPALQRMLVKGWVTAEWKTSPTRRRTRVYALTAAGRRQLGVERAAFDATFAALSRVMKG
jgi:PadR family transcriptional regulator, regulatory protein PadR